MDPRDRKAILGQWGTSHGEPVTLREGPREEAQREAAERDLAGSPVRGKPLPRRLRNFRPSVEGYVVSLGGPRAYMVRLREIEHETEELETTLRERRRELAAASADAGEFARRWRAEAAKPWFSEVNDLVERHNRYYPAEARLPMDPRTKDYALVNGKPYRRRELDAAWVLERLPPVLEDALAG